MARIRAIHPRAPQDDDVATMSLAARYLWAYLPCHADREGRMEERPLMLKGEVFPADSVDVAALLAEMEERRFIVRYRGANGRRLIQIRNFRAYQRPDHRERTSALQAPEGWEDVGHNPGKGIPLSDETQGKVGQNPGKATECNVSSSIAAGQDRSGTPDPDPDPDPDLNLNIVDLPKKRECPAEAGPLTLLPEEPRESPEAEKIRKVNAHYLTHHTKAAKILNPGGKEWRHIRDRLREGRTVEELCRAIDGYHADRWHIENRQLGLELITRTATHVTKGLEFAERPAGKQRDWTVGGTRAEECEHPATNGKVDL